ncbi:hypothetical protein WDJ51_12355 [Rathayibacter sp. YIM 133350]|uniref:hypothetical protein n=1 Tax=Rathayibacter sp. YIM 133350 TaxID=3131992 RepID=UPI00307FA7CB
MKTHLGRPIVAGIAIVVLLVLGAGIASGVGDALGIRSEAADVPSERPHAAEPSAGVQPPTVTVTDAPATDRMNLALGELQHAIGEAPATTGAATLSVAVTGGEGGAESYRLEGTASALRVVAPTEAGAVRGVYDLASAVRDHRPIDAGLGLQVDSALGFRMVDMGSVGVQPDAEQWLPGDDYSHASKAFSDVILPSAPYIDEKALTLARADFEDYVDRMLAEGYNAIAVPGFIEYLTFSDVGDGHDVYAAGDEHIARARAMQRAFGPLWKYAHDLGMKVYFRTDMLSLSTPLEHYLTDRFGGLDTASAEFWSVYSAGLDELYRALPFLDGVLIRIGEAGRVYDVPGWDYYSALDVTSVDAVRAMLTAFTAQAERSDHEVIFRSWSVGVGAVGDMHTNPDSYHAVLDGIDSDKLIVSTKYTLGDFYSHLPLNTTLETGEQRRIIEFQSRREFEAFGSLPNDLGDLYQQALRAFIAANPHVEGIWTWTQDGGPWRAGPMTLERKSGFWQLYDLNTELAVRLARNPDADPGAITQDWARRWFSDDPATLASIASVMAASRDVIGTGLYIGPFAERKVYAIGLEPPPMMWIFEWDILTGDSAVLDVIYSISRQQVDAAIAQGERAVETAKQLRATLANTAPENWRDSGMRRQFLDTLDYQVDLLHLLSTYRTMVLSQAQWHDTLSDAAHERWKGAVVRFQQAADAHLARYEGDVYHPAYNLTAAELGVDRAVRDEPMAWLARVALLLAVGWLALGFAARWPRVGEWPGARAARASWVAATRPWQAADAVRGLNGGERGLVVGVPAVLLVASRGIFTWFEAPAHLVLVLSAWALFVAVLLLAARRSTAVWAVLASVGGAAGMRCVLLLAAIAVTGPGGYWFAFWTDPLRRSAYIVLAFALFGWVLVAGAWALAGALGRRRAAGVVVLAAGAVLALGGGFVATVGLEQALTVWNDQMGLLPWGLSRILGLTVYLDIPAQSALAVAVVGVVLGLVGGVLWALPRRAPGTAAA